MLYGRVIGTVVATKKDEKLKGAKLLAVQRVNYAGEDEGEPVIAIDYVRAGIGDIVLLARGKDAAMPSPGRDIPVETGIVAIVDNLCVKGK